MDQPARTKSDNRINNKDTEEADKSRLTDLETDALGESVNISMGSAAKALSTMLNLKVIITTPKVDILKSEEFEYKSMFPAMSVTIKYIEGLSGLNFFVLKQSDIIKIVNIMLGQPDKNDDDELTELHISAISEVMNQMMGASSTSLATFFNRKINISTPNCIAINENNNVNDVLGLHGDIVVIKLKLIIGNIIDSELISIMPLDFAKEIAENLIEVQLPSQINGQNEKAPEAQNILSDKTESKTVNGDINIKEIKSSNAIRQRSHKMLTQNEKYSEADFADFDSSDNSESAMSNLDLIMDVPLEIVVQIGKTQKPVKDIIKLTQGSIIELEKQAGDPVDIMVNGEMIARGDVVVIDDNFGVRITEILNNKTQIKV